MVTELLPISFSLPREHSTVYFIDIYGLPMMEFERFVLITVDNNSSNLEFLYFPTKTTSYDKSIE